MINITRVKVTEVKVKGQGCGSRSKIAKFKVKGHRSRSKVTGSRLNLFGGSFLTHRLAVGTARRRFH